MLVDAYKMCKGRLVGYTSSRTNYISHVKALGGSRLFRTASGSISLFRAQREAIFLRRLRIKITGDLLSRLVASRSRSSRRLAAAGDSRPVGCPIWEAAAPALWAVDAIFLRFLAALAPLRPFRGRVRVPETYFGCA